MLFGNFSIFFPTASKDFTEVSKSISVAFSLMSGLLVAYESKLVFEMSITSLLQLIACNV